MWVIFRVKVVMDKDDAICHLSNSWHSGADRSYTISNVRCTILEHSYTIIVHTY